MIRMLDTQEEGNVPYVVDGKFGVYTGNRPKKIASTVLKWFSDNNLLEEMKTYAVKLGTSHSEATRLISKDIGDILLRRSDEIPRRVTS
jgi:UDP-N-acetylglucosamine:LPS N-acetylglucosamine transferase